VPTHNFCGSPAATLLRSADTGGTDLQPDDRHQQHQRQQPNQTIVNNGIEPQKITSITRTDIHPLTIRETDGSRHARPTTWARWPDALGESQTIQRKISASEQPNWLALHRANCAAIAIIRFVGSPYQPQNNIAADNYSENNNHPRNNHNPATALPVQPSPHPIVGSPYQPQNNVAAKQF